MTGSFASLPEEVAPGRRDLARVLAGHRPAPGPAAPGGTRPVVALVGAPGRGRRALAAALLDVDADALGAGTERLTPEVVDVPLLEELDLLLPADGVAGSASALLVVAGAGAPLDHDELDRLTTAAGAVQAVVFALVGTEAHRGWRTVLEADRELVAERVPRLAEAPWFPVSPVLAAAARGTGTDGEALRRRAGIAPLQQHLHGLVARRRRMLDEANALRSALTAVRASAAVAVPPDLRRRRTALEAARTVLRREHHVRWRSEIAAARVAVADDLARRVRGLGTTYRDRIDRAARRDLAGIEADLARDLEAVAAAVVAALGERLRGLVVGTLAGLLPPEDLGRLRIPAPVARPELPAGAPRPTDRMLVVAGATGGLGLSRLALLPLLAVPVAPVVGAALVPVSVGIGLGAAGWMARVRRRAADRAHARTWLTEALGQARTDLERVLTDALIVADREITLALDRALDEQARRLGADLADAGGRSTDRERAHAAAGRAEAVLDRVAAALATG